jgi:import inner membrane translocase subunit TIM17
VTGGNFGIWGGLFSTFVTGGTLALRSEFLVPWPFHRLTLLFLGGPRSALGSAIACGILLGVFEGVGVLMSRVFSEGQRPQMQPRKSCLSLAIFRL